MAHHLCRRDRRKSGSAASFGLAGEFRAFEDNDISDWEITHGTNPQWFSGSVETAMILKDLHGLAGAAIAVVPGDTLQGRIAGLGEGLVWFR